MNLLTLLKRLPFSAGFLSTDVIFLLETFNSNGNRSDIMNYILLQHVKKLILALLYLHENMEMVGHLSSTD